MSLPKLRHIGIRVDKIDDEHLKFYENLGFKPKMVPRGGISSNGAVEINGRWVQYIKLYNEQGICIELIDVSVGHLAFAVEQIITGKDPSYYYITPEGNKVRYVLDPSGNVIELVELKK